jgi:hypothetical protein
MNMVNTDQWCFWERQGLPLLLLHDCDSSEAHLRATIRGNSLPVANPHIRMSIMTSLNKRAHESVWTRKEREVTQGRHIPRHGWAGAVPGHPNNQSR